MLATDQKKSYKLTSYPIGSIREMWAISWPLMLGLLSSSLMMFADRFFLARYAVETLTAAANAGTALYALLILPLTIAGIVEVFVGQFHGHDEQHRMGEFAWQMLWFSLFMLPLFSFAAIFFPSFLFAGTGNEANETSYYTILNFFACMMLASQALMGYFAGQGRVKLITVGAVLANSLNICLDILFIFGGWGIPEMGIRGAAYATAIASVVQFLFFFSFFLSKYERDNHGTTRYAFRFNDFWRCLKIGFPAGVAHVSEILVHLAFFRLMIMAGPYYIIIASMVQSFYLLVFFVGEGLSKAVTAIVSNLIGASLYRPLRRVLWSAFRLQFLFGTLFFILCWLLSDVMLHSLISSRDAYLLSDGVFKTLFNSTLFWLACFFLFDGLVWALIGFLTAAGDTRFIMMVGLLAQWLCYFLPVYIGITYFGVGIDRAWMFIALNSLFLMIVYLFRVDHGRWKTIKI